MLSAGALGIEPRLVVLETTVLPLNDAPCGPAQAGLFTTNFYLFVYRVFPTPFTEFIEFQLPLHFLLVFAGVIIPPFTDGATKSY